MTGSRFSGSWASVTGYTNSGISGGEGERKRTKGVGSRRGRGYALFPVGASGGLKACKMDQAPTGIGVTLWYTPLPPSSRTPFITRLHSFLMPLDEHKSLNLHAPHKNTAAGDTIDLNAQHLLASMTAPSDSGQPIFSSVHESVRYPVTDDQRYKTQS